MLPHSLFPFICMAKEILLSNCLCEDTVSVIFGDSESSTEVQESFQQSVLFIYMLTELQDFQVWQDTWKKTGFVIHCKMRKILPGL